MKHLSPPPIVEEVDAFVGLREAEADLIPAGPDKQALLVELARLRAYADADRVGVLTQIEIGRA